MAALPGCDSMRVTGSTLIATVALSGIALVVSIVSAPGAQTRKTAALSGEQAYRQRCASCHGVNGQGAKAHPAPLSGKLSATDLAAYVAKSMPPGPRKCPPADAKRIAAYAYDAFYSPIAVARNSPARIALSRLTV